MNKRLLLPMGLGLLAWAGTPWMEPAWGKAPACPAYEQLRPLLNSERIESCFGSYGVEVLEQQGNLRISSLYSLDGEARITRTLAISEFASDLPASLHDAYQAIRDGASMGATLEASGWQVDKRLRYLGEVPASTGSQCMSDLPAVDSQPLAVQVYDLWLLREGHDSREAGGRVTPEPFAEEVRFALLAELHDPRYLTLHDLQRIYPAMIDQPQPVDPDSERLLQQARQVCKAND